MSGFSEALIERSGYERAGFADVYDAHRPAPPRALLELLLLVARVERPRLVVDLGAGTGLSTRAWADLADEVLGVEPNAAMLAQATTATDAPNVRFLHAFAADTGLPADGADVVTCSQSLHWMEPGPVLAEAARVLRDGGVFAAYDYDVPPFVHAEVDAAFSELLVARRAARALPGEEPGAIRWPKDGHLDRMLESGCFRFTRELLCHSVGETDARRVAGLALSIGGPLEEEGDVGSAFRRLQTVAGECLGDRTWPMVVCYRARVGVK